MCVCVCLCEREREREKDRERQRETERESNYSQLILSELFFFLNSVFLKRKSRLREIKKLKTMHLLSGISKI